MSYDYSENILVQESAGNLLRDELGWDVKFAYNTEVLGDDGTFGRKSYKEILLVRYFRAALKKLNGTPNYFLIWLACGVPFGIGKMFTLIPIGFGISGTVGVVALNIVLGGLIGGVILIYRLAVAVWYLPLTIYRLIA